MEMRIKNWEKFQHFKDRRPPWVKLYRDLLDDKEWHKLDDSAAKLLVMLWLLASENNGNLPAIDEIAFRVRLPQSSVEQSVSRLSHWLTQVDINVISEGYQLEPVADTPNSVADVSVYQETETETETEEEIEKETEGEKDTDTSRKRSSSCPQDVSQETWEDWKTLRKAKKAPITKTVIEGIRREAGIAGMTLEQAIKTSCERNWQSFKAEWMQEGLPHINGFNKQEALEARNRQVGERWLAERRGGRDFDV